MQQNRRMERNNMEVTQIEAVTKTRYKVYVDGQFAFVLYKGELSRYRIKVGEQISYDVYLEIKEEIVLKRAKLRAMHLLNDMDRTEAQLREKLETGGFTEDIVDRVMDYVKSFGYINDREYTRRFVEGRKDRKSRKEIYALLCRKGLDQTLVREVMEETLEPEDACHAIEELMRKKRYCPGTATEKEKQKMIGYLMRKGFRYEDIRQLIQVSGGNA